MLALTLVGFSALTLTFLLGALLEYNFSSYVDAVMNFQPTQDCVMEPDFETVSYNNEDINCVKLHESQGVMGNLTAITASALSVSDFMRGVWDSGIAVGNIARGDHPSGPSGTPKGDATRNASLEASGDEVVAQGNTGGKDGGGR